MAIRTEPTFDELVDELEAWIETTLDAHRLRMREHQPESLPVDPVVEQRLREFTRDSCLTEYRYLRRGSLPDRCPDRDAEGTRELARLGLPVDWVLAGYRVGHRCHWDTWNGIVERRIDDPARRREMRERASRFFFDYVDHLTKLINEEYGSERDRVLRDASARRALQVHELLDGEEIGSDDLGWPLEHHHLGMLAWAEGADEAARELGAAIGRPVMVVDAGPEGSWFAWASAAAPLDERDQAALASFAPSRGRLSLGMEAAGADGFRLTNRQARGAGWVAMYGEERLTRYPEVALEALAMQDAASARAFTAGLLGELAGDSARAARLRETLMAYFRADHNAAATAATLGVHQQTVANRIRSIEELVGAPVSTRRAELEVALRLRRCFEKPPSVQAGLQNDGFVP